jgi:hypothetical protein
MDKALPIIELDVADVDENIKGVDFIAFVDRPAIKSQFMMFSEQTKEMQFKIVDEERRIVSGYAMVADMPIPRIDEDGTEYNVVFRKPVIEKIMKKFAKDNAFHNVNMQHDPKQKSNGVYMIESFMVDSDRGIMPPALFPPKPDGSWFVSYYVEDDNVWEAAKRGDVMGFSVEGKFISKYSEQSKSIEDQLTEFGDWFSKHF